MTFGTSKRSEIQPFLAMDVLSAANEAERAGRSVIHMEVGQPAAAVPESVIAYARSHFHGGKLSYTDALGIKPLRERIAAHYATDYGATVDPRQVVVTTGSSAGFMLAFLAAFDHGDKIALQAPGYPAYRNIMKALGLEVVDLVAGPEDRYTLSAEAIEKAHSEYGLNGVLLASPANPSGTMIQRDALKALCDTCERLKIRFISDEIYHRLVYEGEAETALSFSNEAFVINSFSKYYCMTGWRIGWMIVPEDFIRPVERLAQNLFISAPELSQWAGVAAFDATEDYDLVLSEYKMNRALLTERLTSIGLSSFWPVDGAFYFYVDMGAYTNDTLAFSRRMLDEINVAATPGADFDPYSGNRFIRFSFAGSNADMAIAMDRLGEWLPSL
ncbi:MAG: aminotransferase class I/II-fold pyridoxal phosphate-dependent enzyme [Pseudomonadota bacterium]